MGDVIDSILMHINDLPRPRVMTMGDVIDSILMCINKGNAKGTHQNGYL